MIKDNSFDAFINDLSSSSSAPGGGAASAMVATVGSALSSMLAALTINKKAFEALNEHDKKDFTENYSIVLNTIPVLEELMDKDLTCYPKFIEAYRLPKDTHEEIKTRDEAIQAALIHACDIPMEIMRTSYIAMKHSSNMLHDGNKTVLVDLLAGVIFLNAAIEAASLNVFANINNMIDVKTRERYYTEAMELVNNAKEVKESIVEAYKPR